MRRRPMVGRVLARAGARTTGLDLSAAELRHADAHCTAQGETCRSSTRAGESLPFTANALSSCSAITAR